MTDTRNTLVSLENRIQIFSQQQRSFVAALDRCRGICFQHQTPIRNLLQVMHYLENITNDSRDKRILNMFMGIVSDLNMFRRELRKLSKNFVDSFLDTVFAKWKKLSEPSHQFTLLRAPYPFTQLNHLSCDEARNHFGGIISLIPILIQCARDAVDRIETKRALRSTSRSKLEQHRSVSKKPIFDGKHASGRCTPVCATPSSTPRKNRTRPSSAPPTKTYSAASIKSYGSDVSSPVPSSIDIPVSYSSMEIRSPTPTPTRHSRRPSSAAPSTNYRVKLAPDTPEPGRNSYRKQVVVTSPAPSRNQKNQSVQTPNAFKTTLQPALDWPHKTLTYSEMKRLLRERRIMIARPQWRP